MSRLPRSQPPRHLLAVVNDPNERLMLVPNRANGRPEGGQVLLTQVRARENLLWAGPPLPGTFPRPAVVKRHVADDPLGGIGGAGF
jgi:hypothetical protein